MFADPLEEEFYTAFVRIGMRFGSNGSTRFLKVISELSGFNGEVAELVSQLSDKTLDETVRRSVMTRLLGHVAKLLKDDKHRPQIEEICRRAINASYVKKTSDVP